MGEVAGGPAADRDGPDVEAWQPWTPRELTDMLDGVDVDWCVVGGWAIDLFLGEVTRPHHDLEIAVQREDLAAIRGHLRGFVFFAVGDGAVRAPRARRSRSARPASTLGTRRTSRRLAGRRHGRTRRFPLVGLSTRRTRTEPARRDGAAQPRRDSLSPTPRARSSTRRNRDSRKTRRTSMRRARSCHSRTERGSLMRCDWSIPDTPGSLASTRRTASSRDTSTGRRAG